jgi:hypothetical protein
MTQSDENAIKTYEFPRHRPERLEWTLHHTPAISYNTSTISIKEKTKFLAGSAQPEFVIVVGTSVPLLLLLLVTVVKLKTAKA